MTVDALLQSIPPLAVYGMVGGVVGVESLGIPLPGEIVLVSAALLSSRHELAVNPGGCRRGRSERRRDRRLDRLCNWAPPGPAAVRSAGSALPRSFRSRSC